jgi:hypothetical protein
VKYRRMLVFTVAGALLAALSVAQPGGVQTARAFSLDHASAVQKRLLSGFASFELSETGSPRIAPNAQKPVGKALYPNYFPSDTRSCPVTYGSNVKVNQNCLNLADSDLQGRSQAQDETAIAVDPSNSGSIVAASNDYRRGDVTCGIDYSLDGGSTWADVTLPNGFVRGTAYGASRQYFQASGDPSVAFDTKGNAYYDCQMFQRGAGTTPNSDLSSAVYVFRSTLNAGASWNFPGRPVVESPDVSGTGEAPFEDKPYMTVDNHVGSPFQDRVYVTWTEFTSDGTAYLWEEHSNDYGETFSHPVLVSRNSPLCDQTYGLPTPHGRCNENQFSDPFTGPDGALYVVYDNYNNSVSGNENWNQILLVKSTDGGQSFGRPVRVSKFYDLPDCQTYTGQDPFRACVPEKGPTSNSFFRATNYPSGATDPRNATHVDVVFGSYINPHSNESNGCTPAGFASDGLNLYDGVKTPGACNNDILISTSHDAGQSFTGTTTDPRDLTSVNQAAGQATTDQFWQWSDFSANGKFAVSYFDRQYGSDETNGFSDISLSGTSDDSHFAASRVTTGSMPPPTQFSGLFYGDYSGLAASGSVAYPLWMDTRDVDLFACSASGGGPPNVCTGTATNASVANDQDIFTARMTIPIP